MKKHVVRFLAFIMSITLISTMAVSASAAENNSGYSAQPRVSRPFPIIMLLQNVAHDLNTAGNPEKRFTKSNITESYIITYGHIIHTVNYGKYAGGIGYLANGVVKGTPWLYTAENETKKGFERACPVANLVASRTYFLYAENDTPDGCTMHGTVSADVYN